MCVVVVMTEDEMRMSQVTSPLTVASPGCFPAAGAVVCELALVGVPLRDPRQLLVPDLNTEH